VRKTTRMKKGNDGSNTLGFPTRLSQIQDMLQRHCLKWIKSQDSRQKKMWHTALHRWNPSK
jgi:hypothetical protein